MMLSRLLLTTLFLPAILDADTGIFTWTDARGGTHFGDRPPADTNPKALDLKINTIEGATLNPPMGGEPQVTIYTAAWCGVCREAKRYFRNEGVTYREYDVEKSPKGRRDYARLHGTGVPIILVGEQRMNGFSSKRFESLYQTR